MVATTRLECTAGCAQCPVAEACAEEERQAEGLMEGRSLATASAGYFLAPLALAFAGAAAGGVSQVNQLIGAVVGLGAGMALAAMAARVGRANEERAWLQH